MFEEIYKVILKILAYLHFISSSKKKDLKRFLSNSPMIEKKYGNFPQLQNKKKQKKNFFGGPISKKNEKTFFQKNLDFFPGRV